MKTKETIHVCGTVTKTESLAEIKWNIAENTVVAEANSPYKNYYGQVPEKANPNSLFLFTTQFYFLEEVLGAGQNFSDVSSKKMNLASGVLHMYNQDYPAIRIKHFPDYQNIAALQHHLIEQDIGMKPKVQLANEAKTRISKCFRLQILDKGIYKYLYDENNAYVVIPDLMNYDEFKTRVQKIRNNTSCKLFDAALVKSIINSGITTMARIYSEGIDISLLKCIQTNFQSTFTSG